MPESLPQKPPKSPFLSIGYQAMKAIATFLVTWYNYFSRRFFLEGARS